MKFTTFFVFMALWGLLVYCPVAHWVWSGGWIGDLGVMDFAGGAVVHVNAGFVLWLRLSLWERAKAMASAPCCHIAAPLFVGRWHVVVRLVRLQRGSALSANGQGVLAFTNTQIAAATAMLVWMLIDQIYPQRNDGAGRWHRRGRRSGRYYSRLRLRDPMGAIFVGAITSAVCYGMATMRAKGPVDDSLDAFAVHGVGGFTGAVLTGIFASSAITPINSLPLPGLLEGGTTVFINQVWTTAVVASTAL
jgi:Amt family ammonium transporter